MNKQSFFDTLNLSNDALKTQRIQRFVADASDFSEMLIKKKEMQVREIENAIEKASDLGDDTTLSIANRVSNTNAKELMVQLHTLNFQLSLAQQELEVMRAYHTELFPTEKVEEQK